MTPKTIAFSFVTFAVIHLACSSTHNSPANKTSSREIKNSPSTRAATYRDKPVSLTALTSEIITLVNQHRKNKGLKALVESPVLTAEALTHSQNMATKKVGFGHSGFSQRSATISKKLQGTASTGENVAAGVLSANEVMATWLKSPAHKGNIEGRFDYIGVGVARAKDGSLYFTQIFVKK